MTKHRKITPGIVSVLLLVALIAGPIGTVQGGQGPDPRPAPAAPFTTMPDEGEGTATTSFGAMSVAGTFADPLQAGGDRLVDTQNPDGGWGWPLTGNSAENTIGPIAMGLAQTYLHTGDPVHLGALEKAGDFLLAKTEFAPSAGYLAAQLDRIFGVTTYTEHLNDNFYAKLADGSYTTPSGTFSAETYVEYISDARSAAGIGNLAAWDIGMGLVGAASCGADTTAWIDGTKAEIDALDGNEYYDVVGLAGALYGLAFVGEDHDPQGGEHQAAESLADLAEILASYQIDGGGFTWNSNFLDPGQDETIQETAYAILALNEVSRPTYLNHIKGAADYMIAVQLNTGGWENYTGRGENNAVTGEALWGISTAHRKPVGGVTTPTNPLPFLTPLAGLVLLGLAGGVALLWRRGTNQ